MKRTLDLQDWINMYFISSSWEERTKIERWWLCDCAVLLVQERNRWPQKSSHYTPLQNSQSQWRQKYIYVMQSYIKSTEVEAIRRCITQSTHNCKWTGYLHNTVHINAHNCIQRVLISNLAPGLSWSGPRLLSPAKPKKRITFIPALFAFWKRCRIQTNKQLAVIR